MKRNILNKLLLISCLLVVVSCKAKKALMVGVQPTVTTTQPTAPPPAAVKPKPDSRISEIKAAQLTFNTFSAKADAKIAVDGESNDVNMTIRIDHDKKIWIAVTKTVFVTIDVARLVITPDSLQLLDKIHGAYLKRPFSYLYQYSNSQVSYKMLEALLVGNAMPEILQDNNADIQTVNGNTTIAGTLQDLVYNLSLGADMKVGQFNLSNHNEGQSLQANNSMFIPAGNKTAPSKIDILSAARNKKIQVNLHYAKIDLDLPLTYPFSVPEGYTTDGN